MPQAKVPPPFRRVPLTSACQLITNPDEETVDSHGFMHQRVADQPPTWLPPCRRTSSRRMTRGSWFAGRATSSNACARSQGTVAESGEESDVCAAYKGHDAADLTWRRTTGGEDDNRGWLVARDQCRRGHPLCQRSCRLNRIGTLGARIAESGSIRTSVQRTDSGEAVAAGEFGDRLGVA